MMRGVVELEDARGKRKRTTYEEEMDQMVVKELRDMQQHIRNMLPTNPEIMETMKANWFTNYWLQKITHLSKDIQESIYHCNKISEEDMNKLRERFLERTSLADQDELVKKMEELKAMQLHIQDKLANAEGDQITSRGETMQKWINDTRDLGCRIEGLIEYYDHLNQEDVSYWPQKRALYDSLNLLLESFHRTVVCDMKVVSCEMEDACLNRKHLEEEEMVVKELKDMQQFIRDMLPTNPEIMELLSQYCDLGRWIKETKDLSEDIQKLVDSGNAISKEDMVKMEQWFSVLTSRADEYELDEDMDELKAMQLHIQDKLANDEGDQITSRGETMQKWLDDIRDFSRKIEVMIEYVDHLKKKNVPYRPYKLKDSVKEIKRDFSRNVIQDEPITCYREDDIENMSMWIDFILTSTVSHGITQQVNIQLLENLKDDLLRTKSRVFIPYYEWSKTWAHLRWRFYKIRQIQSLHPVTRLVNWNFFGFTKTQTIEMLKQVKMCIKDKREDAEKWMEERHREGRLNDDTHMFFQQALDLFDHDEPQSTDILAISKLQVDLDKFQWHFFQTSIWVDACIQATGEAKLSSSGFSSRSKEAYYIIKEDTEIMSWQLDVIMLAIEQEGWEKTAGLLHELREDLDQLLKSSSYFRKFDHALLFSAIIGWGLLKWKVQMMDKQIESLLLFARNSSDYSRQEMDGIIKELEDKQKWIKAALYDAEGEEIQSKTHQTWQSTLRDLAYQAEDLIGLYEYQQVAKQVEPTSSLEKLSIFCQERTILREIKEGLKDFKKKFDEIDKNKRTLKWRPKNGDSSSSFNIVKHQDPGVLPRDADKFVGRDEKMKELKEVLVDIHGSEGRATEVIAVVGMGGVGKTTLCQHIYNDLEIGTSFSIKGWIHVGENFDSLHVTKNILTYLSGSDCNATQLGTVQEKIVKLIQGKRFLLVLDDVWSENKQIWDTIRTPLDYAGEGSKMLISTRHEKVAKTAGATKFIQVEKLSEDDGWLLFRKHAFRKHHQSEDLVGVGKAILKKCRGLPLAIKVVGSLLGSEGEDDVERWRSLLDSDWWNFSMHEGNEKNKEILGPLYLSYHHLPRRLKACFRFLSLFGKGEDIEFDHLFYLWLAHDLISDDNGSISMRQIAHKWIEELASRSIVDTINYFEDPDGIHIKVHDLINNIAHFVSGNEFFLVDGTEKNRRISLDGVRHLHMRWQKNIDGNILDTKSDLLRTIIVEDGIHNCHQVIGRARNMRLLNCNLSLLPENLSFARNLRVLKINSYIGNSDCVMLLPTIYMLYNLRQVHISYSNIMNVSCRIGNLINLRHLDLSFSYNMLKMPESVSRLTALQYLNLRYFSSLQELPSGISNLKALQYLNLGGCYSLKELPSGISNLKDLRDLNLKGCESLQELPSDISDLTNLRALDVRHTAIKYMPCGLSRSTKLTCLRYFPLGLQEGHASLKSLKTFQQLEGKLRVEVNIVGCVKEEHAQEIEMSDSGQLSYLSIEFCKYMSDSGEQHEQILQKLKPNVKITKLKIRGYKGVKLPSWMGSRSFDKLVNIELSKLNRCTSLSPLHMLPSLEKLHVDRMKSLRDLLEVALEEENGGSSNTGSIEHPAKPEPKLYFPKLVRLDLDKCGIECLRLYDCWFPALKSLFIYECDWLKDIHFSDPTSALEQSQNEGTPSLTELYILTCPKLYFGRDALLPQSLKELTVYGSDEVKRWCESNRASKLAHIPDIDLS